LKLFNCYNSIKQHANGNRKATTIDLLSGGGQRSIILSELHLNSLPVIAIDMCPRWQLFPRIMEPKSIAPSREIRVFRWELPETWTHTIMLHLNELYVSCVLYRSCPAIRSSTSLYSRKKGWHYVLFENYNKIFWK